MNTETTAVATASFTDDEIIGLNVVYLIARHRDRQATVATSLGMSAQSLSHKLKGRRPWTSSEIRSAAQRYRVTIDSLFKLPDLDSNQEPAGSPLDVRFQLRRAEYVPERAKLAPVTTLRRAA